MIVIKIFGVNPLDKNTRKGVRPVIIGTIFPNSVLKRITQGNWMTSPFDRITTSSSKNRRKTLERNLELKGKKSKIKDRRDKRKFGHLTNSTGLTHGGKPLDFDNMEDVNSESDDEMIDLNDPNVQRKETLNEIIAKYKLERQKKQLEKRLLTTAVKRLDEEFKEVKRYVKNAEFVEILPDDYDLNLHRLTGDKRAMAVERTKSVAELMIQEAEKIKSSSLENPADSVAVGAPMPESLEGIELTYSSNYTGTITGPTEKSVFNVEESGKLSSDSDTSSLESFQMAENAPDLGDGFPSSFKSFSKIISSSDNPSLYIRKCRVLYYTSPEHLKQLLDYLLCLVAYNQDIVPLIDSVYPHLFSLVYDYKLDASKRLLVIFKQLLAKNGTISSLLSNNALMLFKFCTKVYSRDSTVVSSILSVLSQYLRSSVESKLCVEQGVKAVTLISNYCNSNFVYCPEIYVFGLRFFKTLHGLSSAATSALSCFHFVSISEYEPSIIRLFSNIPLEHPCRELYYSILPEFRERLDVSLKQTLNLQSHKKEMMKMQIPVFGEMSKTKSDTIKLKKRLRNEGKSLLRNIRADQRCITGKKVADIKRKDKEYAKYINKLTGDLAHENGEHRRSTNE
eukprot:NODE_67_length_23829_cov_0.557059.p1 type:complete len:622 gc:universal NODE_67_length_23829_cov_0.557059:7058-8923(+)